MQSDPSNRRQLEILLAKQHRNTRHDAIEVMLNIWDSTDHDPGQAIMDIEHAIMNLKQRSPSLPPSGEEETAVKLSAENLIIQYSDKLYEQRKQWRTGQHIGLPQSTKEINAQIQGFEDGLLSSKKFTIDFVNWINEEGWIQDPSALDDNEYQLWRKIDSEDDEAKYLHELYTLYLESKTQGK